MSQTDEAVKKLREILEVFAKGRPNSLEYTRSLRVFAETIERLSSDSDALKELRKKIEVMIDDTYKLATGHQPKSKRKLLLEIVSEIDSLISKSKEVEK